MSVTYFNATGQTRKFLEAIETYMTSGDGSWLKQWMISDREKNGEMSNIFNWIKLSTSVVRYELVGIKNCLFTLGIKRIFYSHRKK